MVGVVERPLERDLRLTVLRSHPVSVFTLGSAVPVNKCAKGVVLPPDFMSSGATKPLPGGGWTPPERPVAEAVGSRILWWGVGIGAVVGLAWVASKRGMLANPSWESTTWEQAYREALREGLKPREAEEYAYEVLQAERDDRLNVLGGALGEDYSNPGRAKKQGFTRADADPEQLRLGIEHELEHTDSKKVAERIALDHLSETPDYYARLRLIEPRS